jgi:hypothetical protein
MTDRAPEEIPRPEWQPFTPRGVAGAASAPRWQMWLALGLMTALWSLILVGFLITCWEPVIRAAISRLPPDGYLRGGVYYPATDATDVILAENSWLAISIRWSREAVTDQASDVRATLQIDRIRLCSILGCSAIFYHSLGDRSLGRADTEAWWNAWRPFCLTAVVIANIACLFVSWWLLTLAYSAVVRFQAFYRDRQTDFAASCRVAQASLIPGALWLTAALFFYQRGWLDLFGLLVVFIAHVPVAWLYFSLAIQHLPLHAAAVAGNPFLNADAPPHEKKRNPFGGGT